MPEIFRPFCSHLRCFPILCVQGLHLAPGSNLRRFSKYFCATLGNCIRSILSPQCETSSAAAADRGVSQSSFGRGIYGLLKIFFMKDHFSEFKIKVKKLLS